MPTRKRTAIALLLCALAAAGRAQDMPRPDAPAGGWDAAAPGRIEPRSREIRIAAPIVSRIAEVLVRPNDKVAAGDLLVRLDDEEALARITAAEAQVALRTRLRNDGAKPKGAAADRRKAEDAVGAAKKDVFDAQNALELAAPARRADGVSDDDIAARRAALTSAQDRLKQQQDALRKLKAASGTPLPSRLEGELNVARAELTLARAVLAKTRIRAPAAGTVLQVQAQPGEIAVPSFDQPMVTLGDLTGLRVRVELEERDIGKVRIGQRAVVRAGAFRGRDFEGKVASIAQIVGAGRINTRGARKLTDVDVLEVIVDLTDPGPLVVGMQVDVYLGADGH